MPRTAMLDRTVLIIDRTVQRFRQTFSLGRTGLVAVSGALVLAATALLGLSELTDSVTESDGLTASDPASLQFFVRHRSPILVDGARIVTDLGGRTILISVALAAAVALWLRRAQLGLAIAPAFSLILASALSTTLKYATGRVRPPQQLRIVTATQPSFPSGHASSSTALYLTLGLVIPLVIEPKRIGRIAGAATGVLLAGLVGLSRLILGVHWLTDVLAGWALGVAIALFVVTGATLVVRLPCHQDQAPSGPSGWRPGIRLLATRRSDEAQST